MSLAYHKLVVWQRADDLFIAVHNLTHHHFPSDERYELGRQLRRSTYSIPANVVEGCARQHTRDRLNFFNIASSSLAETGYGLHAARRLGYIDAATYDRFELMIREVAAPLNGLIRRERAKLVAKIATHTSVIAFVATQLLRWF